MVGEKRGFQPPPMEPGIRNTYHKYRFPHWPVFSECICLKRALSVTSTRTAGGAACTGGRVAAACACARWAEHERGGADVYMYALQMRQVLARAAIASAYMDMAYGAYPGPTHFLITWLHIYRAAKVTWLHMPRALAIRMSLCTPGWSFLWCT